MNQWNSVKDKLPTNGKYLTCSMFCGNQILRITCFSENREDVDEYEMMGLGAGFFDYDSECGYYPIDDITHWMSLPELPVN